MPKKAQVTAFIIVGVSFVLAMVFIFFLRNSIIEAVKGEAGTRAILNNFANSIENKIYDCLKEEGELSLELLGRKGGYFEPPKVYKYNGEDFTYLCEKEHTDDGVACINHIPSISFMEKEVKDYLLPRIGDCIGIEDLKQRGTTISYQTPPSLEVEIKRENVVLKMDYKIELERRNITQSVPVVVVELDIPLGKIMDVVNDVMDEECVIGDFDPTVYFFAHQKRYEVIKMHYPGAKLYKVKSFDNLKYKFQFAVGP